MSTSPPSLTRVPLSSASSLREEAEDETEEEAVAACGAAACARRGAFSTRAPRRALCPLLPFRPTGVQALPRHPAKAEPSTGCPAGT